MAGFYQYKEVYYSTFTVLNWQKALSPSERKEVILNSLQWLFDQGRIKIFSFVIMDNHMHLLWQICPEFSLSKVVHSFLSFTSKQLLELLSEIEKENYLVNKADRKYQFWKKSPLSVPIFHPDFFRTKMIYIHSNPHQHAKIKNGEYYLYSSQKSYHHNKPYFSFLTLWNGK